MTISSTSDIICIVLQMDVFERTCSHGTHPESIQETPPTITVGKKRAHYRSGSPSPATDPVTVALRAVLAIYDVAASPAITCKGGHKIYLQHVILRAIAHVLSLNHDFGLKTEDAMIRIFKVMVQDYADFDILTKDLLDDDLTKLCKKLVKAAARGKFYNPQECAGGDGYFTPATSTLCPHFQNVHALYQPAPRPGN